MAGAAGALAKAVAMVASPSSRMREMRLSAPQIFTQGAQFCCISLGSHALTSSPRRSKDPFSSAPFACCSGSVRSMAQAVCGGPIPLRIEAGAGKKRVPRTDSPKVLNLRSIKKLTGTTVRPRLLVFCSDKHLYAQIVNDRRKEMIVSASTAQLNSTIGKGSECPILDAAQKLGEVVALQCFKMGVSRVIYYRRGTLHWKRVRTFRLAAEEFGLTFEYPK